MIQPLAGEWAIRRSMLAALPIPTGYGVEISTLLDVHARHGVGGIAQVDLGRRAHQHQKIHDLAAMAVEILAVADRRCGLWGTESAQTVNGDVAEGVTLGHVDSSREWSDRFVSTDERPPLDLLQS